MNIKKYQTVSSLSDSFEEPLIDPKSNWKLKKNDELRKYPGTIYWENYKITTTNKLLAQRFLLIRWKKHYPLKDNGISSREFNLASALLKILVLIEQWHPGHSLHQLTQTDWSEILAQSIFYKYSSSYANVELEKITAPQSIGTLDRSIVILKSMHDHFGEGAIVDGPDIDIHRNNIYSHVKPLLKTIDIDFNTWADGGSHGSIPFVVAHLLLADAITTLRSPETVLLLSYFHSVRTYDKHGAVGEFWTTNGANNPLFLYRTDSNILHLDEQETSCVRLRMEALALGRDIHKHMSETHKALSDTKFSFPWRTHTDLKNTYNHTLAAAYIIFLTTMGKRGPSEVLTLRKMDISVSNSKSNIDTTMRPLNTKTGRGLRTEHGVTNLIDESYNILLGLGHTHKSLPTTPLFTALPLLSKITEPQGQTNLELGATILKIYYNTFTEKHTDKLDFDVRKKHGNLTSHQFRHSWAEFALRRFDGNVEELIRQQFMHSKNHTMTKSYTQTALDDEIAEQSNLDYIRELLPRVVYDCSENPDFVGAMALFIKKRMNDKYIVLSPSEVEEKFDELALEFVKLTPHEFGWCLLHESLINAAKCKDDRGMPQPRSTDSKKCNSCSNFLSSKNSHLIKQTHIAITHQDFTEQKIWKFEKLKQESVNAVNQAITLFPEIKSVIGK